MVGTLLETLIALIISAMLAVLAFSYWGSFTASRHVQHDAALIAQTLRTAQLHAMASHESTWVCGEASCTAPFADTWLILHSQGTLLHTALSQKTTIVVRAFPARMNHQFVFTPDGMTDFQNASIYVCASTAHIARRVRINQAGRVTETEDSGDACGE